MSDRLKQPAFPSELHSDQEGLTKREWMVAIALQGLLANPELHDRGISQLAFKALQAVDELEKQLEGR